jgi:hypothetical protein
MKHPQNSVLKMTFFGAVALGLSGCGQNPFPTDGKTQQQPLSEIPYELTVPAKLECIASKPCEFDVQASVLNDMGVPALTATDLPVGAAFNIHSGHFIWTPVFSGLEVEKTVKVYILLASSNDPMNIGKVGIVTIHVGAGITQ